MRICFFLFLLSWGFSAPVSFAFLKVKTNYQPDLNEKLDKLIREKLEDLKNLDQLSPREIQDLQIKKILTTQLPNETEQEKIRDALGTLVVTEVFLHKFFWSAENTWWPLMGRKIILEAKVELSILNTQSGEFIFAGNLEAQSEYKKAFSRAQTKDPQRFLNALEKNKLIEELLEKIAEKTANRIRQSMAGFKFID